jgi:hypothetical protein
MQHRSDTIYLIAYILSQAAAVAVAYEAAPDSSIKSIRRDESGGDIACFRFRRGASLQRISEAADSLFPC